MKYFLGLLLFFAVFSCRNSDPDGCILFRPVYMHESIAEDKSYTLHSIDIQILSGICSKYNFKFRVDGNRFYYCEKNRATRRDMMHKISEVYSDSLKFYFGKNARFNYFTHPNH